jgi:hypothetical protein
MKRLFLLFLCILTVLSCISCSSSSPEHTEDSTRYETPDSTQFIPNTAKQTDSEPIDAAQFITDWKKSLETYLDKKNKENPGRLYFNESDGEAFVVCYYILTEKNVADSVIAQHNMRDLFPRATINPLNSIKMIMIRFSMDDFTQEACDRLEEIKNTEPLIEKLSTGVEGGFKLAYIPNIEYHCKDAVAIEYTVLSPILVSQDNEDIIIKSKEEYDAYIDLTKTKYKTDYHLELLETQRALYDEAFFSENALIITRIIMRGSGSINLSINNVYTSKDKVYVAVKTVEPGGFGTADLKTQSFSISVKKSDIANVNKLITLD